MAAGAGARTGTGAGVGQLRALPPALPPRSAGLRPGARNFAPVLGCRNMFGALAGVGDRAVLILTRKHVSAGGGTPEAAPRRDPSASRRMAEVYLSAEEALESLRLAEGKKRENENKAFLNPLILARTRRRSRMACS